MLDKYHAHWITICYLKVKNCHGSLNQRTISPHVLSQVLGCLHAQSTAFDTCGRSFGRKESWFKRRETVRNVKVKR